MFETIIILVIVGAIFDSALADSILPLILIVMFWNIIGPIFGLFIAMSILETVGGFVGKFGHKKRKRRRW